MAEAHQIVAERGKKSYRDIKETFTSQNYVVIDERKHIKTGTETETDK